MRGPAPARRTGSKSTQSATVPRHARRKPLRVADVMSREVITCNPDTDLARVGWLLWEGDCGALPVLLDGEVIGMITDRDLAMAAAMKPRPCMDLRVSEAMSLGDVAVVHPDATIEEAMEVMTRSRVRRLPVVDAAGRLVGILSVSDVLRHPAGRGDRLIQTLKSLSEPRMHATI